MKDMHVLVCVYVCSTTIHGHTNVTYQQQPENYSYGRACEIETIFVRLQLCICLFLHVRVCEMCICTLVRVHVFNWHINHGRR